MNKYEGIFIIDPGLDEGNQELAITSITDLIAKHEGAVEKIDKWGTRTLGYEINKKKQGFYVLVNFQAKPNVISELTKVYNVNDSIMKFHMVRLEN